MNFTAELIDHHVSVLGQLLDRADALTDYTDDDTKAARVHLALEPLSDGDDTFNGVTTLFNGFPGFDGMFPKVTLSYVAQMLENGVPVVERHYPLHHPEPVLSLAVGFRHVWPVYNDVAAYLRPLARRD